MNDLVLAFFITWTTYGTWLPGDHRGWAKKKVWGVQQPNPELEEACRKRMTGDAVILTWEQRQLVDAVIVEHCRIRKWTLHARNVRTNHVHVVITVNCDGETVREQLKAWGSRCLSDHAGITRSGKNGRRRWWTEGGDIEVIETEEQLDEAIRYTRDEQ